MTTGTARKGYENDEIIAPSETTPVRRNLNCVRISILNVRSVTSDSSARLDKTPRDYSTSTEIIKNKCFIHKVRNHKKNIRMFNMCVCHKMSYRCNALLPIYSVKFYLIEGTWTWNMKIFLLYRGTSINKYWARTYHNSADSQLLISERVSIRQCSCMHWIKPNWPEQGWWALGPCRIIPPKYALYRSPKTEP